jgi:putative nucleotidyltransferase with HDIG domain
MRYRFSQFWRHFRAKLVTVKSREDLDSLLSDGQLQLFEQLPAEYQDHSYRVMKRLRDSGEDRQDLLVAALLHDVGKIRAPVSVWERSLAVLLVKGMPDRVERFSEGSPNGWRKAIVVKAQHPLWGAEMAREAGCTVLTVSLIKRHHECVADQEDTEEAQFLRALQGADNYS